MPRSAVFVLLLLVLVVSELTAEPIEPHYSQEVLDKVDGAKLLDNLFAQNGENVKNYMNLSNIGKEGKTENPQATDELDEAVANLPADFHSTAGIIRHYGYPVEIHHVTTKDGYILEMHRIPSSPKLGNIASRPAVHLQHGLLDSSVSWVLAGPDRGLAFILADRGHDVWLGNYRGNRYSRKHASLDPDDSKTRRQFWSFSWHEMGLYDIPAMIDHILATNTNFEKIHYVGHSQGTTAFFITASERPEYNSKIYAMNALAPVAFMGNMKGGVGRFVSSFLETSEAALHMIGSFELPTHTNFWVRMNTCDTTPTICGNLLFQIVGFNKELFDKDLLPIITKNSPAGAAVRQIIHYGQGMTSGRFAFFNFGRDANLMVYGKPNPPDYRLENADLPINLMYSLNDYMAAPVDVHHLADLLPNVISLYEVPHKKFNHLDYVWGLRVKELVYDHVLNIMDRAESGEFEKST